MTDPINYKQLSSILPNQLPEFIRDDYPTFVALLEAYYEFLEQKSGATAVGRNLMEGFDIDQTFDAFLDHFYNNFLPLIPPSALVNRTLLLKHAKNFYRAKGSEKSYKLLFRILYNEDVTIRYPKDNILVASGGNWALEKSLRIIPDNPNVVQSFVGTTIVGQNSNAKAAVESVSVYTSNGNIVYELFLSNIVGQFLPSEPVVGMGTNSNDNAYTVTAIVSGGVTQMLILNPGTGYQVGTPVPIIGDGVGALATITQVSSGSVLSVNVAQGGAGYSPGQNVIFTSANGDLGIGAVGTVSTIDLTTNRQHPPTFYLNTDIIGTYANVAYNTATFAANLYGTVNVAANSALIIGTGTKFTTQLGANSPVTINGNTSYIQAIANDTYALVNNPFSNSAIINANVVVSLPYANSGVNTPFYNSLSFTVPYGPCGPITGVSVTAGGVNYQKTPIANVSLYQTSAFPILGVLQSNIVGYMRSLGIIGDVQIVQGGSGYIVTDEVVFTTANGSFGRNAGGYVNSIDANGKILAITIDYPRINGTVSVNTVSNTVIGLNGSKFTTDLTVNSHITILGGEERQVINISNDSILTVNTPFSSNNSNSRCSLRKDFIGGFGYFMNNPPTVKVTSANGTNANLVVFATIANSEKLLPYSQAGQILQVQILNPGSHYSHNASADMTHSGDGNAILLPLVLSGVYTYPGHYLDSSSFLSSSSKLENADYYQPYSYVLRNSISLDKYGPILKRLLHPAGMINFAEVTIDSVINNPANVAATVTLS